MSNKFYLAVIVIFVLAVTGWIANLYKFCCCDFAPSYKAEVVRGVGIFMAPMGVVAGYLSIEDTSVPEDKEEALKQ